MPLAAVKLFVVIVMILVAVGILGFLAYLIYGILDVKHALAVVVNYKIIMDAIHKYRMDMHRRGRECEVEYEDMVDIEVTDKRFFDWGYKHILPKDKFELIEPYIDD